jgi:iron complex transport system ATP-binding protein
MVLMGRARHIGAMSTPGRHDTDIALSALSEIGFAELAPRPFIELSGGQRQMVMVARALASEEDILILDEPASGLDMRNQLLLMDLLRRLADDRDLTVLFTTHHPQHALDIADLAILLMGGTEPPLIGPAKRIMTEENVTRLYGVELKRVEASHTGGTCATFIPLRTT